MSEGKKRVLLYSAGLDSFLTYQYLKECGIDFDMVYFDSGARCCSAELEILNSDLFKKIIGNVEIRKELFFKDIEQDDAFIPNRNILAAICAQGLNNYDVIYLGNSLSDRVNDNNKLVFDKVGDLLSNMYDKKIEVTSPFYDRHKCDILLDCLNYNWNDINLKASIYDIAFNLTFSCYNPKKKEIKTYCEFDNRNFIKHTKECGECAACFRKRVVLNYYGLFIPMKMTDKSKTMINKYEREAKSVLKTSKYEDKEKMLPRFLSTIDYVEKLKKYYE